MAVQEQPRGGEPSGWERLNEPFGGEESAKTDSPYPNPSRPEQDPFRVIPAPPHLSNEIWQTSYYDATSYGPIAGFVQRGAGPCDLKTGRLVDGDWPEGRIWKQV